MEIQNLPIASVHPSPMNPRKTFDEAAIKELADNIAHQGLLQPITVRIKSYRDEFDSETGEVIVHTIYEVVCGERRYRACLLNGSETIPAIVREMTDDEAFDAMITENLQRKDVDPIEEAFAFEQLIKKGSTAEEVALRFGKSVRFVQDRVKLNSLVPELLQWVRSGKLPLASAMILAKIPTADQQSFAKSHEYMEAVPKVTAQNYINNLFCYLASAPWMKESEPFTGGCGVACALCPNNSSNAGCLFYELKSDAKGAKCTDRAKMEEKLFAYFKAKLLEHDSEIVKKGGRIERGKAILVDHGSYYCGKGLYERVLAIVDELGYEVFDSGELDKCWDYNDAERIRHMLDSGEMVQAYSVGVGFNSNGVLPTEYYFTKKRDGQPVEDKAQQQAKELAKQYAKVEGKTMAAVANTLAQKLVDMPDEDRGLCKTEQVALAVAVLLECGLETLRQFNVGAYEGTDVFKYAEQHPEAYGKILRKWMFDKLEYRTGNEWNHSESADKAVLYLADTLLHDECEQAVAKAKKAIEKKREKIAKQLAELGYSTDGKPLEFKDTTHYTER